MPRQRTKFPVAANRRYGTEADILTLRGTKAIILCSRLSLQGTLMASLYFEETEVRDRRTAGPYFVAKDEIVDSPRSSTRNHSISMSKLLRVQFLVD
jgi:hypothetical protein